MSNQSAIPESKNVVPQMVKLCAQCSLKESKGHIVKYVYHEDECNKCGHELDTDHQIFEGSVYCNVCFDLDNCGNCKKKFISDEDFCRLCEKNLCTDCFALYDEDLLPEPIKYNQTGSMDAIFCPECIKKLEIIFPREDSNKRRKLK